MNFLETTRGKVIAGVVAGLVLLTLCVSCSRPAYNPGYAGIPVAPAVVQPSRRDNRWISRRLYHRHDARQPFEP